MSRGNKLAVRLSRHAVQRWHTRVGVEVKPAALQDRIRRRLTVELKNGVRFNGAGAIEVELRPGVRAVCIPSVQGGWTVVTIV